MERSRFRKMPSLLMAERHFFFLLVILFLASLLGIMLVRHDFISVEPGQLTETIQSSASLRSMVVSVLFYLLWMLSAFYPRFYPIYCVGLFLISFTISACIALALTAFGALGGLLSFLVFFPRLLVICSFAVYAAECKTIFHPCKRMPLYFLWLISVFALQFFFFPWLVDPLLRLF